MRYMSARGGWGTGDVLMGIAVLSLPTSGNPSDCAAI